MKYCKEIAKIFRECFRWSANNNILSKFNNNLVIATDGKGKVVYDRKRDGILQRNGELYKANGELK